MEYKKKNRKPLKTDETFEPVLKKHVGLIHCENKLTLIQRKICNILLFNALDRINEQEIHEISLKQLCSLVGYNSNDIKLIKKSLKGLISVVMEWNLLDDSKFINEAHLPSETISWHASSLLAGASIEKGLIRYSYSPQIKTVLSSLEIYGRINLFVQSKFNSSYSLVLYENCVRFKTIQQTSWLPLNLFRSLMGIAEGKYASFKELKRNVINVAVNEINQKTDITVEPEYRRVGRQISAIKFLINDNENYKPSFKRVAKAESVSDDKLTGKTTVQEVLIHEFNITQTQLDEIMTHHSSDYILEKIHLVRSQNNVRNKMAYLIAALNKDYTVNQQSGVPKKETDNSYLRELKEASEIGSLRKKYLDYKFKNYLNHLRKLDKNAQQVIQNDFENNLKSNVTLFNIYKKKEFKSTLVKVEFITFLDNYYPKMNTLCLNFEEYLTAEEDEVV